MVDNTAKNYDIILFGVTGFTGKLTAEYLLQTKKYDIRWAACARNEHKAKAVLQEIDAAASSAIPVLVADLVCDTPEKVETLRQVVRQTKLVLTCAGPFEKYGTTLVQLCAELGVSYADITGETDFVRRMIAEHDATARQTGAMIICHCGNDCIPQDLTVYEMHQYVQQKYNNNNESNSNNATLQQVSTYVELPDSAAMSGGTAATAAYQLGKKRNHSSSSTSFDPLLQNAIGTKSNCVTKNISPKTNQYNKEFQCNVGP